MGRIDVEKLYGHLNKITPIRMQPHIHPQQPGHKNSIFLLEKSGENYYLMPSPLFNNASIAIPSLCEGVFMYAILADYPQQVMVGAKPSNPFIDKTQTIEGHSSIALGGDVLYAGELEFFDSKLVGWNNESGHYLPPREILHIQLTPNVKRLLPEELFIDTLLGLF
ncbi:hypothetical protein [Endozoicomonas euniceicola]|uniref:Uncharacterized protein n=1 Tax=Endozoicomonas euniceicola TaxID=1234143 RepID=A0ABY6GW00_9GAMM|nr:hypothetical protein [Endozoicomonas euniceicola]UYM16942.1 hypothetical protein NX720_03185 [Endozoicomonas euniceicola]